jgi:hypothetical protein
MADKYIVTGTTDRSRSGTEEVIFKKDSDGNPVRYISKTHPGALSEDDLATLKSLGIEVEKVSKKQAAQLEQDASQIGATASDTAGAAPVIGK